MYTTVSLRHLVWGALVLGASHAQGQSSVPGHFGGTGDHLGWDANTFQALEVRHDGNFPIQWWTDATRRMSLNPTVTTGSSAFYPNILNLSGHLHLGNHTNANPLTYLHINHSNLGTQGMSQGFRPWMKVGVLSTVGTDGMYVGMRRIANLNSEAVINWSDDASSAQVDALRFIFSSTPDSSRTAGLFRGLELARMIPDASGNQGYLGVGDFQTASVQPTERLDLLNGRARIRQLPDDVEAPELTKFLVVDDVDPLTGEYGVIKWREIDMLGDCDWELTSNTDVVTAYDPSPATGCPGETNNVGIGNAAPFAKLDVIRSISNGTFDIGISVGLPIQESYKVGVETAIGTSGPSTWGYRAKIDGATDNYGISCYAGSGSTPGRVIGGDFFANGGLITDQDDLIAVRAEAVGSVTGGPGWALWAEGLSYTTAWAWTASDQNLKENIEELDQEDALSKLLALNLKTYSFKTEEYDFMNLAPGLQRGLLSQELEVLFPDLVMDVTRRGRLNEDGGQIDPDVEFKAVNYMGLLPIMLAAIQQQNALIEEERNNNSALSDRMDQLEQLLALCCQNPDGSDQRNLINEGTGILDQGIGDRNLRIQPNPFNEQTTIYYNLERGGRMQLMVNSTDGKHLRVLEEAQMEAGEYQYAWYTAGMSAGIYYVTLLLDGEPVVKKAVKVN